MNILSTARGSLHPGSDGWQVQPEYAGEAAPRQRITYYCATGHETAVTFAADAQLPDEWPCPKCGEAAGLDRDNPPGKPVVEVFKTHFDYVRERRTDAEAEELIAEAITNMRKARR
jgi:hypothetical protein